MPNSDLELVILEQRCPECKDHNLYFLPNHTGEGYAVECDTCGWEAYFTLQEVMEERKHIPKSTWQCIQNWQDITEGVNFDE